MSVIIEGDEILIASLEWNQMNEMGLITKYKLELDFD